MGSPLKVDPAQMAKGKDLVTAATADVKKTLGTLQNEVDELLAGWQSAGATGFSTAHAAWNEKATTIASALEDLGDKLGIVGVKTGQSDSAVAGTFHKFAN